MGLKRSFGALSLLAGASFAAPAPAIDSNATSSSSTSSAPKLNLLPVSSSAVTGVQTVGRNITPQKSLSLAWQTPNNDSAVSVALEMQNSAVSLEDVDDVAAVDCTGQTSVAVTFSTADAFNEALTTWAALNDSFVLITNHLGDCDAEVERGFFVADSDTLASFETNLTIIARAEKSDLVSTASSTSIDFSSVAKSQDKRAIDWDSDGLSIAYNYSIPSDQTIVDTDYVTVVVNEASVNNSVTYSGHAKWELFKGVTEFYLDINKDIYHYADLDITVKAPWTDTWTWTPAALSYSVIDIPAIISLGPSAGISFGGKVSAAVAGSFYGDFTSQMPNGVIHIDFVNWDQSYSDGWTTEYDANFNTTEEVSLTMTPYIDFTVEFACTLFDGLIDLSTGVKAEPSFPFVTAATLTQTVATNSTSGVTNVTYPDTTSTSSCANGLSEDISFEFDIIAFATEWVSVTLYEYKEDFFFACLDF